MYSPMAEDGTPPVNGPLAQMAARPPPPPPPLPQQQHVEIRQLPPLTEERFMDLFIQFSRTTGIKLSEQDFVIEGRQVDPWVLHRAVFVRNGFDSVTVNNEWPVVGAALGFGLPPVPGQDPTQVAHCPPTIAHRLQQIYKDSLRHFDQTYISTVTSQSGSLQTWGRQPFEQQGPQPYQPSEANYQLQLQRAQQSRGEQRGYTPPPQQPQPQHQQQHPGGEPMHGGVMNLSLQQQQQFLHALRAKVAQGTMTLQQARERVAMMQASAQHSLRDQATPQQVPPGFTTGGFPSGAMQQQIALLSQRAQASTNNQMNPLQRMIQAQEPSHVRQFGTFLAQGQQQDGSGFATRVGQNGNTTGMGLSQGQGALQANFVQPSPSVPPTNVQPSALSASHVPPPGGQPVPGPPNILAEMPLQQLVALFVQLRRAVGEAENVFQTASNSGGDDDIQQRQLRSRIDGYKQRLLVVHDLIQAKSRASGGGLAQQAVNGAWWSGPNPAAEGSAQQNSPSLHQAPVNQMPPQRSTPTPLQNFVPSATPQSNLAQMSPHVSANGLPSQSPIQPLKITPLPEDRFKNVFMQFTAATGMRISERDLIIDGRQINLWALHRTVFVRSGFDSVSTNDEWPIVGAALGFPPFSGGDAGQPPRCAPAIAHRLHQLYNDFLRQFDETYTNSVIARLRATGRIPPQVLQQQQQQQQQSPPHRPTEADYQALLTNITSESSLMTSEAMSILPRFSHSSALDLEAHRVPQYIIGFVEQNREHLQRAAQDQNGFRAGLASTKGPSLDSRTQVNGTPLSIESHGPTGTMQMRRPTQEEVAIAKRWVDEQKRVAFSRDFDGVAGYPTIPESDIQEYHRDLERLDQVLANMEKYIHIAYAALKKEVVVQRMFTMMASAKVQLEELKKPNSRYVLELHTIRGMIQEADCMDKGMKTVLGIRMQGIVSSSGAPSVPQPPPRPPSAVTPPPQAQPAMSQGDESAPSPEGAMSDPKDPFDEEVAIAMAWLRI